MKSVDFLIIGGGAAGTTAAQVIRSLKPEAAISILSDENYEMYSRVLLPNYIRGEINREQVFLKKPDWYQQNRIELVKNASAQKLLANEKTLVCGNGNTYKYDKSLIATGALPIKLNVPGNDLGNISYMWTINDADKIVTACQEAKEGLIIGGGFIGLEFAHSFKVKGIETTILEGAPYYWGNRLDESSSKVLQNILEANGIRVIVKDQVEKFIAKADGAVGGLVTKSGQQFDCDLVGIGIGIRSDLSWLAAGSGIKIDGGIVTNEYLETSIPDVYAAGDCVSFYDLIIQAPHIVGTWANATTQGSVVARNMMGIKTIFEAVSSYTINFFGASCSFIGMTDENFADEIIDRGSVEAAKMSRIFLKKYGSDIRIVGATVINEPSQVMPLASLIKNKVDIATYKNKVSDIAFDLKSLVS